MSTFYVKFDQAVILTTGLTSVLKSKLIRIVGTRNFNFHTKWDSCCPTNMKVNQVMSTWSYGWWRGVVGNAFRLKRSYSTPGPVSTVMGDCLWAGKSSRCEACQLGRLSLLPSVGW